MPPEAFLIFNNKIVIRGTLGGFFKTYLCQIITN